MIVTEYGMEFLTPESRLEAMLKSQVRGLGKGRCPWCA